ncbi:MAG TPA: lysophospholipid acyltransferase family protein, partial [Cyclobacteriaceae bacterium]
MLARLLVGISSIIPRGAWLGFCGFVGGMTFHLLKRYQAHTINHLTLAFPELEHDEIRLLAKKVFVMVGKNGGDVLRSFSYSSYKAFEKIRVTTGMEHAERAYQKGKGVLFLTAHIGAFELMATEMAFRGYKPLIVGSPLKEPLITNFVWKHRQKMGADVIERGKETLRLLKNLKSGGTMGILIDQDTRVKSVFADFFGKPCATPVGAAMLALKTGAAVVPVFCHLNNDGKQQIDCFAEIELVYTGDEENDIVINTQNFTKAIENEI